MKIGVLRGSFDFFHNSGRSLLTMALIGLAAYECATLIVEDNLLTLYRVGLVVLGLAAFVAILKDWRKGVYAFVAWIAVEDLIRKYLGNNMIVFFAKDFLALALYLSFFVARRSTFTKLYRPPFLITFFVFAGRFQNFLLVSWILALGFGGFLLMRKQSGRLLGFTTVGIVAAASLLTASRGVILWVIASAMVIAPAVIWGASWAGQQRIRVMRAVQRAAVFVAIALTILVGIFPQEVASRLAIYTETLSPSSSKSELGSRSWNYPLQNFVAAFDYPRWPYGYGIGTASLGVQYAARIRHAPPLNVGVESC